MSKNKLSAKSAEEQLEKFYEWYEMDPEDYEALVDGNESMMNAFAFHNKRLIRAIRSGKLEIREETAKDGSATLVVEQTLTVPVQLKNGDIPKIVYKEYTGRMRALYRVKDTDSEELKNYKKLSLLSGYDLDVFYGMKRGDPNVAQSLGFLLSQA